MAEELKKPIKRVLMLADFACATGFANVAQNIVTQLLKDPEFAYQMDIVAINYFGLPNEWQNIFPAVRLFPASFISKGDVFGREGYLNLLSSGAYDIAWILQDTFQIEIIADKILEIRKALVANGKKPFKFIYYYPIDAAPKENWITKTVSLADIPVVYTKYGYNESIKWDKSLEEKLKVIPHGVDTTIFRPLEKAAVDDFRQKYFEKLADDKFLITNVNRNQPRKDVARTLQIFSLVKKRVPNALLYLHMKRNDVAYDLGEVARQFELIPNEDYICPVDFDENQGQPPEILNYIYNASDLVMTTTLGEGWGLSMTEAMAAGTPVIAPNNTSLTEMLEGRGTLVDSGRSINDWIMLSNDNERKRPLASVTDYVDKIVNIAQNYPIYEEMAKKAQEFVTTNWDWSIVGQMWRDIFKIAVPTQKKVTIGRNDPCHCGSKKKYKACHYLLESNNAVKNMPVLA